MVLSYRFWRNVKLVSRAVLIFACLFFVVSLFGDVAAAIGGFILLLMFGVPAAGIYARAHARVAAIEDFVHAASAEPTADASG